MKNMKNVTRIGGAVSFLLLLAAFSSEVMARPQRPEDTTHPNTIDGRMATIRHTLAAAQADLSANLANTPSQEIIHLLAQWGDWGDGNAWDDWSDWSDGWSDWSDGWSDWNDGNSWNDSDGWSDWNDGNSWNDSNGWSDWNDGNSWNDGNGWSDWNDGSGWSDWNDY